MHGLQAESYPSANSSQPKSPHSGRALSLCPSSQGSSQSQQPRPFQPSRSPSPSSTGRPSLTEPHRPSPRARESRSRLLHASPPTFHAFPLRASSHPQICRHSRPVHTPSLSTPQTCPHTAKPIRTLGKSHLQHRPHLGPVSNQTHSRLHRGPAQQSSSRSRCSAEPCPRPTSAPHKTPHDRGPTEPYLIDAWTQANQVTNRRPLGRRLTFYEATRQIFRVLGAIWCVARVRCRLGNWIIVLSTSFR